MMTTDPKSKSRSTNPGTLAKRTTGALAMPRGDRLVELEQVGQETANGYLRLTAHILLRAQRRTFQTIGVISAVGGEGRTTAAVNLAMCLGRTRGRTGRVLLVDGDVRNRGLSRMIGGPTVDPALDITQADKHPMLLETGFEGVDLMTAPVVSPGVALHDPAAWIQTLHEMSTRYTQIVIDCPPVLESPEALILRECAEELVLVVRAGVTPQKVVERALGNVRKRVLGVILNGVDGRGQAMKESWA